MSGKHTITARLASTLLVLPFFAAIACGGRFDGVGSGDGGPNDCPTPSAVSGGAACTTPGLTCQSALTDVCGSGAESCTCTNGTWACAEPGIECPPPPGCPAQGTVQPGERCDYPAQTSCNATATVYGCGGAVAGYVSCSCAPPAAGRGYPEWQCEGTPPTPDCTDAEPPPPPGCPDPSTIAQGGACGVPNEQCSSRIPYFDCGGNVAGYLTCYCEGSGGWICPQPESPLCDAGPPGCPDPTTLVQGEPCSGSGQTCPGHPTVCNGQTDYDAFQCQSGVWVDVASTVCEVDAGIEDGGVIVDAGSVDAKGM